MRGIFSYLDYRRFLSDFYEERKRLGAYSYRQFSQRAGLNSPNYLALVIAGQRDLTVTNIHQFSSALGLKEEETEFFETLVLLNQAQSDGERDFYEKRRKKLVRSRPKEVLKRAPQTALREWYYTVILVLAHDRSLEETVQKVHSEIGLKKAEIQKTLEELIRLGLLKLCEEGVLKIESTQVTFHDPKGLSLAQKRFLYSQLLQSLRAFKRTYDDQSGKFISHSLTVPPDAIELIHRRLILFVEGLSEEMDALTKKSSSQVAQINVQIFHPRHWTS